MIRPLSLSLAALVSMSAVAVVYAQTPAPGLLPPVTPVTTGTPSPLPPLMPNLPPTAAPLPPTDSPTLPPMAAAGSPVAPVPAGQLPAVLPPLSSTPVTATVTAAVPSATSGVASDANSSMGSLRTSILFTPNQIHALHDALVMFEIKRADGSGASDLTVEVAPDIKRQIVEPATYPVFYLSSIVYHSPTDWSIWVSGRKITSTKNGTTLKVLSVSAERVAFSWTPAYAEAINLRKQTNLFAKTDAVRNKLTTPSTYSYDPKAGVVTFSLLSNQSFVGGYFNTFEGYVESPKLDALPATKPGEAGATAPDGSPIVTEAVPGAVSAVSPPLPPPSDENSVHKPNEGLADDAINALINKVQK